MELTTQSQQTELVHERVIHAVAETRDVTPLELTTPLFDVIDPDCLDRLVESANDDFRMTFGYHGCQVTVQGDREVHVEDAFVMPEQA